MNFISKKKRHYLLISFFQNLNNPRIVIFVKKIDHYASVIF